MNVLKLILKIIWSTFAVIGLVVVAGAAYLWFVDPLNLKPVLFPPAPAAATTSVPTTTTQVPTNGGKLPAQPQLTPQQQTAANSLGLDPNAVATLLNPTTEACAVAALGKARVDEIKAGAAPTAVDIYAARSCLIR